MNCSHPARQEPNLAALMQESGQAWVSLLGAWVGRGGVGYTISRYAVVVVIVEAAVVVVVEGVLMLITAIVEDSGL